MIAEPSVSTIVGFVVDLEQFGPVADLSPHRAHEVDAGRPTARPGATQVTVSCSSRLAQRGTGSRRAHGCRRLALTSTWSQVGVAATLVTVASMGACTAVRWDQLTPQDPAELVVHVTVVVAPLAAKKVTVTTAPETGALVWLCATSTVAEAVHFLAPCGVDTSVRPVIVDRGANVVEVVVVVVEVVDVVLLEVVEGPVSTVVEVGGVVVEELDAPIAFGSIAPPLPGRFSTSETESSYSSPTACWTFSTAPSRLSTTRPTARAYSTATTARSPALRCMLVYRQPTADG